MTKFILPVVIVSAVVTGVSYVSAGVKSVSAILAPIR